ncbi:DUF512 domain-containing protein [Marinisporobacter balticus]|uniref:Putative radical SAM enzyme (TIGR03279 family) n=1 Tax=Marinisporobacter balticus TaxID=2018667 RepID=A0A4R2K7L0_9FIRM|nr:DUF512 domain-containing protein [Marinisporobacter balticus]TCO67877.1 putative radical SAM enzyme (TIGR03279 family) [Marinisporobacter balticus]
MTKKAQQNIISKVYEKGKAQKLGIEKGDKLLKINGQSIADVIEYMFIIADEYLEIEIEKKEGCIKKYSIYKEFDEDLGIEFENPIIDQAKSCQNKCIFCFIDQLPPNMRKTLYFKDDDSRLSFLQGNFITLTNMTDVDIEKIIKYRISPINISIHTTDPALRIEMLHNKRAKNLYARLERLAEAGIKMNGQIVLCPGVNDKENLDKTIHDLSKLYPNVESIAIVPVGITKFREGLYPLTIFNQESATEVINQVENLQDKFLQKLNTRFVHLSDEFYVLADRKLPKYEDYEGFAQIENGVGLMTKFEHELMAYLKKINKKNLAYREVSVATGKSAYKFMNRSCKEIEKKFRDLKINVFEIKNNFFGETITVTGLITATDLIEQLKGKPLGEQLMIPSCMLKADEQIFLDDLSVDDLEKSLNTRVVVTKIDGEDFVENVLG